MNEKRESRVTQQLRLVTLTGKRCELTSTFSRKPDFFFSLTEI